MSLFDSTQLALEAAMRGATLRQTLLTDNLANVDTPGYQRKDVDFHATLRAVEASDASDATLQDLGFQPTTDASRTVRADGSGIDADQESATLAENSLDYQALVQVDSTRNSILQTAIGVR